MGTKKPPELIRRVKMDKPIKGINKETGFIEGAGI
jgi:hypothetical protein